MTKKRKARPAKPRLKFKKWFAGLKEFLESEDRATILTDMELHTLVNFKLAPRYRVSFSTFERWKSPTVKGNVEDLDGVPDEMAEEFRGYLAVARAEQKMELYDKVIDEIVSQLSNFIRYNPDDINKEVLKKVVTRAFSNTPKKIIGPVHLKGEQEITIHLSF